MQSIIFEHPISKSRYNEGSLICACDVQDEHVTIQRVVRQYPDGSRKDITNELPKHGFCHEDIVLMTLNNAIDWAEHGEEYAECLQWNEVTNCYESF